MKPKHLMYDPLQTYAVAAKAFLETAEAAQTDMINTLERMAETGSHVDWVTVRMPYLSFGALADETMMRQAFHRMADANLRGWEIAATMLRGLPSWASLPARMPGTVLTDWFDQVRRANERMMPQAFGAWPMAAPFAQAARATTPTRTPAPEPAQPKAEARPAPKPAATPKKAEAAPIPRPVPDGPPLLDAPRGQADDLTEIKGIGKKLAELLNTLGIYHFDQIAKWTKAEMEWIDDKIQFKGRVAREKWVQQAKALAKAAKAK